MAKYKIILLTSILILALMTSSCDISDNKGTLIISSSHENTVIYINDISEGNAPLTLQKDAGSYEITALENGFEQQTQTVTLGIQEELEVHFEFQVIEPVNSFDSFLIIGRPGEQFYDSELDSMSNYNTVIIEKWHADWNVELHQQAARELKSKNPDMNVLPYLNARYRFFNDKFGQDTFDDSYYLRNLTGHLIPFIPAQNRDTGEATAYYLDLSNPELRKWLIDTALEWNEITPYDGIFFDNAVKFAYDFNRQYWNNQLGPEKVDAWNEGLLLLLKEAKESFNDKIVLNNGFSRRDRTLDRNLEQLEFSDGALNEVFCLSGGIRLGNIPEVWDESWLIEDLELVKELSSKGNILLLRSNNIRTLEEEYENNISRFCMGLYALAHVPEKTYYKYGYGGYNARFGEIEVSAEGSDVLFGIPQGDYYSIGDVLAREYEHGYVLVNLKLESATIQSPDNIELLYGGSLEKRNYAVSEELSIGAQEAIFAAKV